MISLRASSWILSLALHGALILALVEWPAGSTAFDRGPGAEMLRVEHIVPIESVIILSDSQDFADAAAAAGGKPRRAGDSSPPAEPEKILTPPAQPPPAPRVPVSQEPSPQAPLSQKPSPHRKQPQQPGGQSRNQTEMAALSERRGASAVQSGGGADPFNVYLRQLREALERSKVNPNTRMAGKVVLRATIAPSGKVLSRNVLKSSGVKTLDEAALMSLDRASPLPAMPANLAQAPFELAIPFKFSVR